MPPTPLTSEGLDAPVSMGPVRILGLLGRGAMGKVFKGEDTELGRPVAVKVLTAEVDEEALLRFDREAVALARLQHPNVVAIYQKGVWQQHPYFCMELVDGPTLQQVLDGQGPFSLREALEIMRQAVGGLQAAAEAGVIHRDVKPGNLLLAKDGTIKVGDFGVCRLSDSQASATEAGTTLGTPFYMAPEQARGERVDWRADQYALGATFYHLVSGHPPFAGQQTVAQLLAHQKEPPPALHQARPGTPPAVSRVIQRMMAKQPGDRFPSYAEALDALDMAIHAHGGPSRWFLAGGIMALACAVAVGIMWFDEGTPPPTPPSPQPSPPANSPPPAKVAEPNQDAPPRVAPEAPPTELPAGQGDALMARIASGQGKDRASAMTALARSGDARARPTLERVLKDPTDQDAPLAAVLLGELGDQLATDALVEALGSARRATVLAAVDSLSALRDVRAVVPLKALARKHPDPTVRARAQRAGALLFAVDGEP